MKTKAKPTFDDVFRHADQGWQPRFDYYRRAYHVKRDDLTRLY